MAGREKELVKNTIVLAWGKFCPMFVSVVTLPIITACLTKKEYGTYDLIITLVMLLVPLATLQLQSAAFRFLIDKRGDVRKSASVIVNMVVIALPVTLVASFGIFIILSDLSLKVRIFVAIYFFLYSLDRMIDQITRGLGKNQEYSRSFIFNAIAKGIGFAYTLVFMNAGLVGILLVLTIAELLSCFYLIIKIKIWRYLIYDEISIRRIHELVAYSWPMIPNNLSNWVLRLSDRMVISYVLGIEANAIYAVANRIPNFLLIMQLVVSLVWQENASIALKDEDADEYFSRMFDYIYSLITGLTALLISITPITFRFLIRGNYEDAYLQMPLLFLGMFFFCMSAFQEGIYIAHKKTKSVGMTTIIAAVINLALDILLVHVIGITAASISTLVAYFILYIFKMIDLRRIQHINYMIGKQVFFLIIMIIMLFLFFWKTFFTDMVNIIIGILMFYVTNRKLIFNVLVKYLK